MQKTHLTATTDEPGAVLALGMHSAGPALGSALQTGLLGALLPSLCCVVPSGRCCMGEVTKAVLQVTRRRAEPADPILAGPVRDEDPPACPACGDPLE